MLTHFSRGAGERKKTKPRITFPRPCKEACALFLLAGGIFPITRRHVPFDRGGRRQVACDQKKKGKTVHHVGKKRKRILTKQRGGWRKGGNEKRGRATFVSQKQRGGKNPAAIVAPSSLSFAKGKKRGKKKEGGGIRGQANLATTI